MSDWLDAAGRALWDEVSAWVARGPDAPWSESERDALARRLFSWQRGRCKAIDRVARAFAPDGIATIGEIPGVPTDAFKSTRIACFEDVHSVRTFRTSGTTRDVRGAHSFADTSLYARAAVQTAARDLLLSPPYRMPLLAERERDAPDSSLSFMLARFAERFSADTIDSWMIDGGHVDVASVREAIVAAERPVALLGASFAFVHLLDAIDGDLGLPPGSVIMPTGGFKGRSRELAPDDFMATIAKRFRVDRRQIVQEYGMTELSSQAYERDVGDGLRYVPPPWMAVFAVDPERLTVLPHGQTGLLKIIDLLNVGSCVAVQTSDLGTTFASGFVVHGRAPGATPRGCARAIDALLSGRT